MGTFAMGTLSPPYSPQDIQNFAKGPEAVVIQEAPVLAAVAWSLSEAQCPLDAIPEGEGGPR